MVGRVPAVERRATVRTMNETSLTINGNVCTSPRHVVRDDGLMITSFRIASTARKFDRDLRRWVDGETTFLTVSCFRALAANVAASVLKGQRVTVVGKLRVKPWSKGERSGTNVEVEAYTVGHDLAWGTADFTRVARFEQVEAPGRAEADALAADLEHELWQLQEAESGGLDPQHDEREDELEAVTPAAAGG